MLKFLFINIKSDQILHCLFVLWNQFYCALSVRNHFTTHTHTHTQCRYKCLCRDVYFLMHQFPFLKIIIKLPAAGFLNPQCVNSLGCQNLFSPSLVDGVIERNDP